MGSKKSKDSDFSSPKKRFPAFPPTDSDVEAWLNLTLGAEGIIDFLRNNPRAAIILITEDIIDEFFDMARTTDNVERGGYLCGFSENLEKYYINREFRRKLPLWSSRSVWVLHDDVWCENVAEDVTSAYLPEEKCSDEVYDSYEVVNTIHTHPNDYTFSPPDISSLMEHKVPKHNVTGGKNPVYQLASVAPNVISLTQKLRRKHRIMAYTADSSFKELYPDIWEEVSPKVTTDAFYLSCKLKEIRRWFR